MGYIYPILTTETGMVTGSESFSATEWSGTIHGMMIQIVLTEGRGNDLHKAFHGEKLFITSEVPLNWYNLRAFDLPEKCGLPMRASIGNEPMFIPKVNPTRADHWRALLQQRGLNESRIEGILKTLGNDPEYKVAYESNQIDDDIADIIEDSLSEQDEEDEALDDPGPPTPQLCGRDDNGRPIINFLSPDESEEDEPESEDLVLNGGLLSALPSITTDTHSDYCPSEVVTDSTGFSPEEKKEAALFLDLTRHGPDNSGIIDDTKIFGFVENKGTLSEFLQPVPDGSGKVGASAYKVGDNCVITEDALSEEVLGRARFSELITHAVDPYGRTRASRSGDKSG